MITARAYAKINLTLDILGKRDDGYHEMDMLMQRITLCDELTLEKLLDGEETRLSIESCEYELSATDNLILKAHRAVEEAANRKLPCFYVLSKKIPVAAGLGGGSANAAAAIDSITALYELEIPLNQKMEIAASIGSDVPFFLFGNSENDGKIIRALGRGVELQDTRTHLNAFVIVIKPCEGLSTAAIFSLYKEHEKIHPDTAAFLSAVSKGDFAAMKKSGGNSLLPAALSQRPPIADAIAALYSNGADFAAMSGSGSCVFGLFADEQTFDAALKAVLKEYPASFGCHTA